jgi:hypothetical protein
MYITCMQSQASPAYLAQLDDFFQRTGLKFDVVMIGINRMPAPSGGHIETVKVSDDLTLYSCDKECSIWGTVSSCPKVLGYPVLLHSIMPRAVGVSSCRVLSKGRIAMCHLWHCHLHCLVCDDGNALFIFAQAHVASEGLSAHNRGFELCLP